MARTVVLVEIAGLTLLAQVRSTPAALLAVAVIGIGVGLVYPSAAAITLTRAHALHPGVAVGAMTSFWDLGILAAGLLGGLIAVHLHYPAAFLVAAAAGAAALLTTVALRGSDTTNSRQEEPADASNTHTGQLCRRSVGGASDHG